MNRRWRESGSGHMKSLVYEMPVPSVEDLLTSVTPGRIHDMPEIFKNGMNSMQKGCQACQTTSDCNYEQMLLYNLSIKFFCPIDMLLFLIFFSASLPHSSQLRLLRPCIPM
ncbi:hypothetical protein TNCV_1476571 [Trichonephila clavipes]|nr:hypothetical protein TNCV_1476571 [Trichonephila clavipes]